LCAQMARKTSPKMSPGDCIAVTLLYGFHSVLVPKRTI
jgi:hypothetical protein